MSEALRRQLIVLRRRFAGFAGDTGHWLARRRDLAPLLGKAWARWHKEMPIEQNTFAAFVRELDPALPTTRKEYKRHASYNAAVYLRQLALPRMKYARQRVSEQLGLRAVLVRVLRVWIASEKPDVVWTAVAQLSKWDDTRVARLRRDVERVKATGLPRLVAKKAA